MFLSGTQEVASEEVSASSELSEEVPELLVPPQATRESTMARARTAAKNFLFIINILSP